MDKLISVNELKEWIENWFKLQDYYKYGDAPTLRDKKVSRKKIDLDELYDILERMPDERVKTNFEWLVKEKELRRFLNQLHGPGLSAREICNIWGIETPPIGLWQEPMETIADWLAAPHIDKDIFDEEEIQLHRADSAELCHGRREHRMVEE